MIETVKWLCEVCLQNIKNFIFIHRPLPCFQHYQKAMLSTISFSKTALLIRKKKSSKKAEIWANMHFSKIFDKVGRILTVLKFSLISFLPFLFKGVTSANFKEEGKLADLIAPFMLVYKISANISIFSLIIYFLISLIFTSLK